VWDGAEGWGGSKTGCKTVCGVGSVAALSGGGTVRERLSVVTLHNCCGASTMVKIGTGVSA